VPAFEAGRAQARTLAASLAASGVERILSSPALRCRQTLAPLAHATGIPIEIDERLAEGGDEAKLFEAIASFRNRATALCTHGDAIGAVLERFRAEGLAIEDETRCERGSCWSLEGRGERTSTIRYAPPNPTVSSDGDAFGDASGSAVATATATATGIALGDGDDTVRNYGEISVTAAPQVQALANVTGGDVCIWFFGWWCGGGC